ncbi:MAG: PEP-CTERM sorting domain-containing protein [Planctomycetota bacterium]
MTINNAITTDPAFSTLSAGQVTYDNSLVSGSGNSTIALTASNFNFNTFAWDGTVTPGQTGDSRSNFTGTPTDISPFSAIQTPYNDGSGAGNAQFYYVISVNDVTGTGLTFIDGELDSMDFVADIDVDLFVGPFASFGPATFSGTVTGNGLGYTFDVEGTEAAFVFSGLNLVGNRAGTASVVPEPTSLALLLAGGVLVTRRRRTA